MRQPAKFDHVHAPPHGSALGPPPFGFPKHLESFVPGLDPNMTCGSSAARGVTFQTMSATLRHHFDLFRELRGRYGGDAEKSIEATPVSLSGAGVGLRGRANGSYDLGSVERRDVVRNIDSEARWACRLRTRRKVGRNERRVFSLSTPSSSKTRTSLYANALMFAPFPVYKVTRTIETRASRLLGIVASERCYGNSFTSHDRR